MRTRKGSWIRKAVIIGMALLLIVSTLLGACTKEVVKEVPVEKVVVKEVIKEVPVEKIVVKEVPAPPPPFPTKSITWIVPYGAGGGGDLRRTLSVYRGLCYHHYTGNALRLEAGCLQLWKGVSDGEAIAFGNTPCRPTAIGAPA